MTDKYVANVRKSNRKALVFSQPEHKMIEVDVYFLETRLKEIEQAASAKGQILSNLGLLLSCVAAWNSVKPNDQFWMMFWVAFSTVSALIFIQSLVKMYKMRGKTISRLLEEMTVQEQEQQEQE